MNPIPALSRRRLFPTALPRRCHAIRDTALALLLTLAVRAGAAEPTPAPAPCCPPKAASASPCCPAKTKTPAPCCAAAQPSDPQAIPGAALELPAGDFTRESLYQLEAGFTDDAGQPFALGSLHGRPVVLTMFFASCGYACPLLVGDMTRIREALPADLRARAALVLVSFDPARDTPAALRRYREERGLDAGWILLHGCADTVRELAALLGVKYKQETSGQFAHSNLISVLNPEGEIVHQRAGLKGGLAEAGQALLTVAR